MAELLSNTSFGLLGGTILIIAALFLFPSNIVRWLDRKRYQYEVTTSLYMLTPTEKFIFSKPFFDAALEGEKEHGSNRSPSLRMKHMN